MTVQLLSETSLCVLGIGISDRWELPRGKDRLSGHSVLNKTKQIKCEGKRELIIGAEAN